MITYCYAVWGEFSNFIGGRGGVIHWLLFLLSMLCCFFMGKEQRKQLFWPAVLVLIFFFNPVFYAVVGTKYLSGVYWRLLWMLPSSFIIAYTLTQLVYKLKRNAMRIVAAVAACACIIITGAPVISGETYGERENEYEIPQAVIEISEIVKCNLHSWKEYIIVPYDLLCSMRQYSSAVALLYGRNAEGFISTIEADEALVFNEMRKENPDVEMILTIAKQKEVRYVVFDLSFQNIPEDLTEYGYEFVALVEDRYVMYQMIVD